MTKEKLAEVLDVSRDTMFRILKTLENKDLIIRDEATKYIKTKDNFNELIANKHDWLIGFAGKESALLSGNFNLPSQNQTDSLKLQPSPSQNQTGVVAKSDAIYISNNNKDNILSTNVDKTDKSEKKESYGNEELNHLKDFLLEHFSLADFQESATLQRRWLKHIHTMLHKKQDYQRWVVHAVTKMKGMNLQFSKIETIYRTLKTIK